MGLLIAAALAVLGVLPAHPDGRNHDYLAGLWPKLGQASYAIGGRLHSSPSQRPVPIASLAKVMTAYLILRDHPLAEDQDGFSLTVTERDVSDTHDRRLGQESVVAVAAGEVLTERQALAAVLLPSANNVAIMLARRAAGDQRGFVLWMNRAASSLGMHDTVYTDPSGLDPATRSTAADQVLLAEHAMRIDAFRALVALTSYQLPVAGTVHNTDILLGRDGFVGIKTGSDDAAGGCFVFLAQRMVAGRQRWITGAVLGQPGPALVTAGQYAALQLVGRLGQPVDSAGTLPPGQPPG